MNKEILRLMAGFRRFRSRYFDEDSSIFRRLQSGQAPKTLMIACSDSRVDPAILSDASPGEIFVVRNVANLVPPYELGGTYHGVSAAIEFAVVNLKVENVVILGHRQCGGIRSLMADPPSDTLLGHSFVAQWMQIAAPAREKVLKFAAAQAPATVDEDTLCRHCELESIAISLENLMSFPFVKTAVGLGTLTLQGAYFDLEVGELHFFDSDTREFRKIELD